MVMALIWNDTRSFKQHLEDMRLFRQSHRRNPDSSPNLIKDMPTPRIMPFPGNTGGVSGFISTKGKSTMVPIWEIALPRGSQN
jgi:hypothetical protein